MNRDRGVFIISIVRLIGCGYCQFGFVYEADCSVGGSLAGRIFVGRQLASTVIITELLVRPERN